MATRPHIPPLTVEDLAWSPRAAPQSARTLAERVREQARSTIGWYVDAKRTKKRWAQVTRVGAIVFTTLTALFTGMAAIAEVSRQEFAEFAAAFAAVAGILVGLDRFFGFSKGWMRYISTELKIRSLLNAFNLSWPARETAWTDGTPNPKEVDEAIAASTTFIASVDSLIRQETDQWIADFEASLKNLEDAAKAAATAAETEAEAEATRERQREADRKQRRDAKRPGALNVSVSNGPSFSQGWTLILPGREDQQCSGKTVAVTNLAPGQVSVAVEADDDAGNRKHGQKVVDISPGEIGDCSLTLE